MLTYREFKAALPPVKRDTDTIWAKVALRPLSQPTAWLLYRAGVSGNAVSLACVVGTLAAGGMLALGSPTVAIVAIVIFNLVALGDCVDGNIARASGRTGPGGEWMDALSGYAVCAILPLALGWRLTVEEASQWPVALPLLVGAVASSANLFVRLIHHKFLNGFGPEGSTSHQRRSLLGFFNGEASLGGWMMPLLLATYLMGASFWYLVAYAFFYCLGGAFITLRLVRKAWSYTPAPKDGSV